jgi:hypothetical protein
MQDSSHTEAGISHAVSFALSTAGSTLSLTVSANQSWLDDPSRVYPVVIDPTVVYQGSQESGFAQCNLFPSQAQTNCGSATGLLWVGDAAASSGRSAASRPPR